jgi:Uma2 family endonuclease
MSPFADNEHQGLAGNLSTAIRILLGQDDSIGIFPACNVSDQPTRWTKNYRCPDVAVFLPGNPAVDRGTHWLGGPDFAVEILSPGDRSRKKFDFYAAVGVRELMLVDRDPWTIELYRQAGSAWQQVGVATTEPESAPLVSTVLDLEFHFVPGQRRPRIEVTSQSTGQKWLV